jgi:hypothetical protein
MADDYEKLMAEVEQSLGGTTPAKPTAKKPSRREVAAARRAAEAEAAERGRIASAAQTAVVSGVVAAAGIFVLFAFLPFLRAGSGAWGAFIATTIAVFITSLLRRG